MKQLMRWVVAVGLVCAAALSAGAKENWKYARTEHFEMFTSASERESRRLLNELEQFRAGIREVLKLEMTDEVPVTVMLFGSSSAFDRYAPPRKGGEIELAGYFANVPERAYITLHADDWDQAYRTIYYGYALQVIRESGLRAPLWVNSGLARVFQTAEITLKKTFLLGKTQTQYLQNSTAIRGASLRRYLAATPASPEYRDQAYRQTFDSLTWLLMHYLVCGADRTNLDKLHRYIELAAVRGADPVATFEQAFGLTCEQMEEKVFTYLSGGRFYMRERAVAFPDLADSIRFAPADEAAKDSALALLEWRARMAPRSGGTGAMGGPLASGAVEGVEEVKSNLLAIALRAPQSPKPHEALAAVATIENNRAALREHMQKAADLGSDNASVPLVLAREDMRDILQSFSLDYRMPPLMADPIKRNLDRANALRPGCYAVLEQLAMAEAISEKQRIKVINQIQEMYPRMKNSARTLLALAIIRWRVNDEKTCRQMIAVLEAQEQDKFVTNVTRKLKARLDKQKKTADAAAAEAAPSEAGSSAASGKTSE